MRVVEVVKKEYQTVLVDTLNEAVGVIQAVDVIYDKPVAPESVQEVLDELLSEKHTHANKAILDEIEEPFKTSDKAKLDSFNAEAEYVEVSRNINTIAGLSGGGNLGMDRVLKLSLKDLSEDFRPAVDRVNDFIITVDSEGNQNKSKLSNIPSVFSYITSLPVAPVDGQTVYYSNGVDKKFLVMYKELSTMPTAGVDGWYKISDDTLLVI